MSIRVALHHKTDYLYNELIQLTPHLVRLRPAPHTRTPVHRYSLKVEPKEHFIHWQQDPFGNHVASFTFREKTRRFSVEVDLVVEMVTINPFDFFVEEYAETVAVRVRTASEKGSVTLSGAQGAGKTAARLGGRGAA